MSTPRPPITLSTLDLERLEALLEQPAHAAQPGAAGLREELDRADVLPPAQMPADVVTMNSQVSCVDTASGTRHTFTLVYPERADRDAGRVSVLAPVGTALLGLRTGDRIEWPGPGGRTLSLQVDAIDYQPEASGDLHR